MIQHRPQRLLRPALISLNNASKCCRNSEAFCHVKHEEMSSFRLNNSFKLRITECNLREYSTFLGVSWGICAGRPAIIKRSEGPGDEVDKNRLSSFRTALKNNLATVLYDIKFFM